MNKENKNKENEISIDYPDGEEDFKEAYQDMNIVRKEDGSEDFRMIAKFNLSKKAMIEKISKSGDYINSEDNTYYSEQDVKEFIRRLREELRTCVPNTLFNKELDEILIKLAGKDLI